MIKKSFLLIVLFTGLFACKQKSAKTLEVNGTVKNFDKIAAEFPGALQNGRITILLKEMPFGEDAAPVQLDSTSLTASNNSFELHGKTNTESMYEVEIENGPAVPLINDNNSISVKMDFADKNKFYTVKGSEASNQLHNFIFDYSDKSNAINIALMTLDSLKRFRASDSLLISATNEKNKKIDELNQYLKVYLDKINQPIVASFALGRAAQTLQLNDFEAVLGRLVQKFPADATITSIKTQFESFKNDQASAERLRKERSWIGKKAPDLTLPDPNGKNISLSSFRGKYVLVDFWASWCGPCRKENPNVVYVYNQFKNKNFTILGVSLDKQKDDWLKAIQDDHLTWTHISDLAYWDSKAVSTFHFDGIPFNLLIDPQGTVIAESLRGDDLTGKLAELLK